MKYVDVSSFHLTPEAEGRFRVFEPKSDREYAELAEVLHVNEVGETILKEGLDQLENAGKSIEPGELIDWSKFYQVYDVKTKEGESLYIFMAIMAAMGRDFKYSKLWIAFLCTDANKEHLLATQQEYHKVAREALKAGHSPREGGNN